jgi:hypothetical protein
MREESVVVGGPSRGRTPGDIKKDLNLQQLTIDYNSIDGKHYLRRISNILRDEI